MKTLIRISMALVAVSAFSLSFQSLMALAVLTGYGQLSWLYPVTLDLGTVASCAAWLTSKSRQAFHQTWTLLAASILLNGCEHWLVATKQLPAWELVTVIAMAPPAILGVVTHLAVGLGSGDRNLSPALIAGGNRSTQVSPNGMSGHTVDAPGHVVNRSSEPSPTHNVNRTSDGMNGHNVDAHPDPVAELLAQGAGRRKIAAALDISEHQARQLLASSRNGHGR